MQTYVDVCLGHAYRSRDVAVLGIKRQIAKLQSVNDCMHAVTYLPALSLSLSLSVCVCHTVCVCLISKVIVQLFAYLPYVSRAALDLTARCFRVVLTALARPH